MAPRNTASKPKPPRGHYTVYARDTRAEQRAPFSLSLPAPVVTSNLTTPTTHTHSYSRSLAQ
eukprot:scaffold20513_cov33-Tisochrysis_lutea.AAC.3